MFVQGTASAAVPGPRLDWNPPATSRVPEGQVAVADPVLAVPLGTAPVAVTSAIGLLDLRQYATDAAAPEPPSLRAEAVQLPGALR